MRRQIGAGVVTCLMITGSSLLGTWAWSDLHNTVLGNREVGNDIKRMIDTKTADRWTKTDHDEYERRITQELAALREDVKRIKTGAPQ